MRLKQSLCFPMFKLDGMELEELFQELQVIGFAAVEFWGRDALGDYEGVIERAKNHGLAVVSMIGHSSLQDGLNKVENHDRIEVELKESIDIAAAHGIPGIICFSGNRNSGQSDYEGLLTCAQGLKRVAPYAEEKAVNLNVELLNSRIDHPGYQCDCTGWGVALCELVGSPRVKLLYDIYHMQIMEGDIIRTIRKYIRHIGHFHTAGNPGRMDPDDDQELNYAGICRAIVGTGYDLYVGHEYQPKGDLLESLRVVFKLCDQR